MRSEGSKKLTTKSLGKQFSDSLKILRSRIELTVPHYVSVPRFADFLSTSVHISSISCHMPAYYTGALFEAKR